MAAPVRGNTGHGCYFITASTFQKQSLFQRDTLAQLFLQVLQHYRRQGNYLLHEFVLMPDHFHLLLSPVVTLERSVQLIKGGFSYRARKQLGFGGEVWQPSYHDRQVRDVEEYWGYRDYIHQNPVKRGLAKYAKDYRYGSAWPGTDLDSVPQRLKPQVIPA